jgi:hypothetical protein
MRNLDSNPDRGTRNFLRRNVQTGSAISVASHLRDESTGSCSFLFSNVGAVIEYPDVSEDTGKHWDNFTVDSRAFPLPTLLLSA